MAIDEGTLVVLMNWFDDNVRATGHEDAARQRDDAVMAMLDDDASAGGSIDFDVTLDDAHAAFDKWLEGW